MDRSGRGIVTRSTGSNYSVRDSLSGESVDARIRGKLRLKGVRSTNPIAVGDEVEYETDPAGDSVITAILPRRNYVIRRSPNLSRESHIIAANLDQAAIVVTLSQPRTNPEFIDRFLVTCEAYNVPATILLNKVDLAREEPEVLEEFLRTYTLAGYTIIRISATVGINMESLRRFLEGKTTLLSGNSGVGKSTLILALDPAAEVRTAQISDHHHKGRHTTTFARMYPLPFGGDVIDTPGIKGFGLLEIEPQELYRYFPEMMRFAPECQYYNCTHTHEPHCAVRRAVEQGEIAESRYISYIKILEEDEKYRK